MKERWRLVNIWCSYTKTWQLTVLDYSVFTLFASYWTHYLLCILLHYNYNCDWLLLILILLNWPISPNYSRSVHVPKLNFLGIVGAQLLYTGSQGKWWDCVEEDAHIGNKWRMRIKGQLVNAGLLGKLLLKQCTGMCPVLVTQPTAWKCYPNYLIMLCTINSNML